MIKAFYCNITKFLEIVVEWTAVTQHSESMLYAINEYCCKCSWYSEKGKEKEKSLDNNGVMAVSTNESPA